MPRSSFNYAALGAADPIRNVFQTLMSTGARQQMAQAQGGLLGAQTAEAAEKARGLAQTNDFRADPQRFFDNPAIKSMIEQNPHFGRAYQAAVLFGLGSGEMGDVAGQASKLQSMDLTGLGVAQGDVGDVAGQNRLISAATGKTHEPFKALGNTGYGYDAATGDGAVLNNALATAFGQEANQKLRAPVGAPIEVTQNGVPTLVQRYADGSLQPVHGFGPKLRDDFAIQTNPDGTVSVTRGPKAQKLTEQQSKDLVYLERGESASSTLDGLDTVLASPLERSAGAAPGVGNFLVSDNFQKANQAAQEFLAAVLRKDTGAAITAQEFDIYGKVYLPQPGDSEAVIRQKRQARRVALDAIRKGLGPFGDSATTQGDLKRKNARPFEYEGRRGIMFEDGSYEWTE